MLTINNAAEREVIVCKGNTLAAPNYELNRAFPVSHSAERHCELVSLFSDILLDFIPVFFLVLVTIPSMYPVFRYIYLSYSSSSSFFRIPSFV
jgi:hypothetical protein